MFLPAQSARKLIQKEFNQVFKQPNLLYNENVQGEKEKVHILLVPSATSKAPTLDNKKGGIDEYINDVMTLPANLAGIPAITVPFKNANEYPIGLQLLGQYGYDKFVLRIADIMTK